jgi:hypothetical protein
MMNQTQTRSAMQSKESNAQARRLTVEDAMPSASDFVKKLYKYVITLGGFIIV